MTKVPPSIAAIPLSNELGMAIQVNGLGLVSNRVASSSAAWGWRLTDRSYAHTQQFPPNVAYMRPGGSLIPIVVIGMGMAPRLQKLCPNSQSYIMPLC